MHILYVLAQMRGSFRLYRAGRQILGRTALKKLRARRHGGSRLTPAVCLTSLPSFGMPAYQLTGRIGHYGQVVAYFPPAPSKSARQRADTARHLQYLPDFRPYTMIMRNIFILSLISA